MSSTYWQEIAQRFSIPEGVAYLNNGSFGPVPTEAIETTVELFRTLESNPQEYLGVYRGRTAVVKDALGGFVGMKPDDFVFVTNVTVGMNMVAAGLRTLSSGDQIVTTDQEYGAVENAWRFASRRRGVEIVRAALPAPADTPQQLYDAVVGALTARTRIIYMSHITSQTGVILPVKAICEEARRRGILTAIDGAHAPGMIPLDIESLGCDFYVGNCHKWLCAPKGVGFMWASAEAQDLLDPLIVGWGWVEDGESFLGNFENPGTHNPTLYLAVEKCIELQNSIGREAVAARGRELASYARERILAIPGAKPRTPPTADLSNSIQAYTLPLVPDFDFQAALRERRIVAILGPDKEHVRLRVSTHIHNDTEHLDRLVELLHDAYGR